MQIKIWNVIIETAETELQHVKEFIMTV